MIKLVRRELFDVSTVIEQDDEEDNYSDDEKTIKALKMHHVITKSENNINEDGQNNEQQDTVKLHQNQGDKEYQTVNKQDMDEVEMVDFMREKPEIKDDKSASLNDAENSLNDDQDASESEF